MLLSYEDATANFRILTVKPFRYHVPRHKWNIGDKGRHFSGTLGFGLLLLMFLFGFIGAAGQGSDSFSQGNEDAHLAQMMTHHDLSSSSQRGLLTEGSSIENHRKTYAIESVAVGDSDANKPDDFNHSISRKPKNDFLERSDLNSGDNSHVQVEHIQFDTYMGGSNKKAEEEKTEDSSSQSHSSEPMTFAQNLKAKLKESQSQLLPVVPIQLPSPDKSHRYHYTDDEDSEFSSFSQFASSHSHLDNVDFVFGNNSLYSKLKRRKKTKNSIQKYIFPDSDAADEEYIKQAAIPILKTQKSKRPSASDSESNSTDSFVALASSQNFPPLHFFDNFVDEYPFRVSYSINKNHNNAQYHRDSTRNSENGGQEDLNDSYSHHNYHEYYNRNEIRKKKHKHRKNELSNSLKYADYKDNPNDHEDGDAKENESQNIRPTLDGEDEIVVKRQAGEIFRIPIPNSTSATKTSKKSEIIHETLSNENDDDDETDYNLSSIASSTFGLREHPKILKSIHSTYNPLLNKTTIESDRDSSAVEIDDAHEDRSGSDENRESKNNNDNQSEISSKLRDSFSDTSDNEGDKDFSGDNDNNSLMMRRRPRRSVVHLYDMVVCATGCNPLMYKGYGCYCGFLGSGLTVDGIDKCCAKHDWCYHHAKCPPLLTYFVPYYWTCNDNRPKCVTDYRGWKGICGTHLCECDRQFAECLRKFPCPRSRAMCMTSPWRFWQNLLMSPPYRYG